MAIDLPDGSSAPARGPAADYCPFAGGHEGHHMVSHSGGQMVKWVEICSLCGWIDTAALDRWAADAIINAMTKRAQRIAVATETEPFTFVQSSTEELPLKEIVGQALGAASMCWEFPDRGGIFDSVRAGQIYRALEREIEAAMERTIERTEARMEEARELSP